MRTRGWTWFDLGCDFLAGVGIALVLVGLSSAPLPQIALALAGFALIWAAFMTTITLNLRARPSAASSRRPAAESRIVSLGPEADTGNLDDDDEEEDED